MGTEQRRVRLGVSQALQIPALDSAVSIGIQTDILDVNRWRYLVVGHLACWRIGVCGEGGYLGNELEYRGWGSVLTARAERRGRGRGRGARGDEERGGLSKLFSYRTIIYLFSTLHPSSSLFFFFFTSLFFLAIAPLFSYLHTLAGP